MTDYANTVISKNYVDDKNSLKNNIFLLSKSKKNIRVKHIDFLFKNNNVNLIGDISYGK